MAQRFKAKTLLSNSGVFNNEVIAPNLVYNTGNQTISGTKTFDVAPILGGNQLITGNLSLYATTANLISTGSLIDTLSGNLISTGSRIDTLSGQVVFNTGNQTISGVKTFATGVVVSGNLQVSGTGIFNAIDLNSIDNLSLSGVDIIITSGIVTLTNAPILSGNPLITGNLSLYATTVNLISTGSRIDALSGNLITTGSRIDTLSGNLITTGSRIDTLSGQVVFTTGNQTISGIKSFATGIDIINSGNPQNLRIFNKTGTNTGEFGIFGWNNNQLTIGAQQTNSGILRDVLLTGANININSSGVLNIFDPVNITGNVTITGHLSASSKSFLIDHPTQLGKKLQYGSLEGPEHGVFVRGKTSDTTINLPNYWASLVDENSISVNLTPIDIFSNIYVVDYNNRRIIIDGNNGNDYFYTVYGERKDIPKLTVEF